MKVTADAKIKILENVLIFGGDTLQLSNVCNIKVALMPKKKYQTWMFIVIAIAIFLSTQEIESASIFWIVGIIAFAYIAIYNLFRGTYLSITMNSGESFFFSCMEEEFLHKAANEITKRLNEKGKSIINFQNCKIESSQIASNNSHIIGG